MPKYQLEVAVKLTRLPDPEPEPLYDPKAALLPGAPDPTGLDPAISKLAGVMAKTFSGGPAVFANFARPAGITLDKNAVLECANVSEAFRVLEAFDTLTDKLQVEHTE